VGYHHQWLHCKQCCVWPRSGASLLLPHPENPQCSAKIWIVQESHVHVQQCFICLYLIKNKQNRTQFNKKILLHKLFYLTWTTWIVSNHTSVDTRWTTPVLRRFSRSLRLSFRGLPFCRWLGRLLSFLCMAERDGESWASESVPPACTGVSPPFTSHPSRSFDVSDSWSPVLWNAPFARRARILDLRAFIS